MFSIVSKFCKENLGVKLCFKVLQSSIYLKFIAKKLNNFINKRALGPWTTHQNHTTCGEDDVLACG